MAGISIGCLGSIIFILVFKLRDMTRRLREEHRVMRLLVLYLLKEHETLLQTKPGSAVLQIMHLKKRIIRMLTAVNSAQYVAEVAQYQRKVKDGVRP